MSSSPDPLHGNSGDSPSDIHMSPERVPKRRRVGMSHSTEASRRSTPDTDRATRTQITTKSRAGSSKAASPSSPAPVASRTLESTLPSTNGTPGSAQQTTTPSRRTYLHPGTPDAQYESENTDMASSPLPYVSNLGGRASPKLRYAPKLALRGHKRAVSMVRFSPDGRWIASCSADATAKIWDSDSGRLTATLSGHIAGLSCLAWAPDSALIATGSDDKSIRLWAAPSGKPYPMPLIGHNNYVYSVAFSPKGNMLVSGSYDEAVLLWDVRTGRILRKLPAHSDPVGGVDFVMDGTLIASCSSDGLIRVWDTATGQCLRTFFHEDTPPAVSVRFSPNGRYILAWMLDSSLRMWNYVEGRCVKTYQGHRNVKYSLNGAFGTYGDEGESRTEQNPTRSLHGEDANGMGDGSHRYSRPRQHALVLSGSEDGAVLFWDVVTKEVLQRLEAHDDVVLGVDMHPQSKKMVSCSSDRTVKVWAEDDSLDATHVVRHNMSDVTGNSDGMLVDDAE